MHAHRLFKLSAPAMLLCLAGTVRAQVKVTSSAGDVVTFTQKNVVDHMIVGDSIELEAAQLAAMRTQNVAVKELATMLVTDHRAHLDNLHKLAGKKDIGREANSSDTSGTRSVRMLSGLRSMPADSGFDRAFVQQQVRHHEHEIASLKMLRAAAKDDDLQHDIDRTLPVLERHLAKARAVAAQIGVTADTSKHAMPPAGSR